MSDDRIEVEVAGLMLLAQALIESHPDKRALLAAFDSKVRTSQAIGLSNGMFSGLPDSLRQFLLLLRAEIEQGVQKGSE